MVRSLRVGALAAALAITPAAWAQTFKPEQTVIVREGGKAITCRVLKTWKLPDGSQAYQVQAAGGGEVMTIVDGNGVPSAAGQKPAAATHRIFRWGKAAQPTPTPAATGLTTTTTTTTTTTDAIPAKNAVVQAGAPTLLPVSGVSSDHPSRLPSAPGTAEPVVTTPANAPVTAPTTTTAPIPTASPAALPSPTPTVIGPVTAPVATTTTTTTACPTCETCAPTASPAAPAKTGFMSRVFSGKKQQTPAATCDACNAAPATQVVAAPCDTCAPTVNGKVTASASFDLTPTPTPTSTPTVTNVPSTGTAVAGNTPTGSAVTGTTVASPVKKPTNATVSDWRQSWGKVEPLTPDDSLKLPSPAQVTAPTASTPTVVTPAPVTTTVIPAPETTTVITGKPVSDARKSRGIFGTTKSATASVDMPTTEVTTAPVVKAKAPANLWTRVGDTNKPLGSDTRVTTLADTAAEGPPADSLLTLLSKTHGPVRREAAPRKSMAERERLAGVDPDTVAGRYVLTPGGNVAYSKSAASENLPSIPVGANNAFGATPGGEALAMSGPGGAMSNAFTAGGNSRPIPSDFGSQPEIPNAFVGGGVASHPFTAASRATAMAQPQPQMVPMMVPVMPRPAPTATVRVAPPVSRTPGLLAKLQASELPSERESAVEQLRLANWQAEPAVVDALVRTAQSDPAPAVRVCSLRVLGQIKAKTPTVVDAVRTLKADGDFRVRQQAEETLAAFGAK